MKGLMGCERGIFSFGSVIPFSLLLLRVGAQEELSPFVENEGNLLRRSSTRDAVGSILLYHPEYVNHVEFDVSVETVCFAQN